MSINNEYADSIKKDYISAMEISFYYNYEKFHKINQEAEELGIYNENRISIIAQSCIELGIKGLIKSYNDNKISKDNLFITKKYCHNIIDQMFDTEFSKTNNVINFKKFKKDHKNGETNNI